MYLANMAYGVDMFKTLKDSSLPRGEFFTVHIGPSSKRTMATYHLLETSDLIDSLGLLVGTVNLVDMVGDPGPAPVDGDELAAVA